MAIVLLRDDPVGVVRCGRRVPVGAEAKLGRWPRARMPSQITCDIDDPYLNLANGQEL